MIFGLAFGISTTRMRVARILTLFLYTCKMIRAFGIGSAFRSRCWKYNHAYFWFSCQFTRKQKHFHLTFLRIKRGLLTWSAVSKRWSYEPIWTCTFWFVIYYLTNCTWCTWVSFGTWVYTFCVFTCIVKRTFVIVITSNCQNGFGW